MFQFIKVSRGRDILYIISANDFKLKLCSEEGNNLKSVVDVLISGTIFELSEKELIELKKVQEQCHKGVHNTSSLLKFNGIFLWFEPLMKTQEFNVAINRLSNSRYELPILNQKEIEILVGGSINDNDNSNSLNLSNHSSTDDEGETSTSSRSNMSNSHNSSNSNNNGSITSVFKRNKLNKHSMNDIEDVDICNSNSNSNRNSNSNTGSRSESGSNGSDTSSDRRSTSRRSGLSRFNDNGTDSEGHICNTKNVKNGDYDSNHKSKTKIQNSNSNSCDDCFVNDTKSEGMNGTNATDGYSKKNSNSDGKKSDNSNSNSNSNSSGSNNGYSTIDGVYVKSELNNKNIYRKNDHNYKGDNRNGNFNGNIFNNPIHDNANANTTNISNTTISNISEMTIPTRRTNKYIDNNHNHEKYNSNFIKSEIDVDDYIASLQLDPSDPKQLWRRGGTGPDGEVVWDYVGDTNGCSVTGDTLHTKHPPMDELSFDDVFEMAGMETKDGVTSSTTSPTTRSPVHYDSHRIGHIHSHEQYQEKRQNCYQYLQEPCHQFTDTPSLSTINHNNIKSSNVNSHTNTHTNGDRIATKMTNMKVKSNGYSNGYSNGHSNGHSNSVGYPLSPYDNTDMEITGGVKMTATLANPAPLVRGAKERKRLTHVNDVIAIHPVSIAINVTTGNVDANRTTSATNSYTTSIGNGAGQVPLSPLFNNHPHPNHANHPNHHQQQHQLSSEEQPLQQFLQSRPCTNYCHSNNGNRSRTRSNSSSCDDEWGHFTPASLEQQTRIR